MNHQLSAFVLFIGITFGLHVYSQEVTESPDHPAGTTPKVSFPRKKVVKQYPQTPQSLLQNQAAAFDTESAVTSEAAFDLGRSRKTIEFSHHSEINQDQLVNIPNQILPEESKRSFLIAQEIAANLPSVLSDEEETKYAQEKYHPTRASALDLVDFPTPKIQALADQLGGDVVAIFKYVRDQIRTEHQPKASKGAHMTLVLGSGGAGDKAALLFSLLRASGKLPGDEIRYANAQIKLPYFSKFGFGLASLTGWSTENEQAGSPTSEELQALTALANDQQDLTKSTETELVGVNRENIAYTLIDNSWTLRSVPQTQNYLVADRVWVKVKVNGEW